MAKKHKEKKKDLWKLAQKYHWGIVLVVIFIFILFNILGIRVFIINTFSKLLPTPTPTHPQKINISPPSGLSTDQSNYTNLAVSELAKKLKIKKESIKVITVKSAEWNDTSLGCPEKGKLYIQTVTQGFVIELLAGGKTYIYNGGLNRVVYCQLR